MIKINVNIVSISFLMPQEWGNIREDDWTKSLETPQIDTLWTIGVDSSRGENIYKMINYRIIYIKKQQKVMTKSILIVQRKTADIKQTSFQFKILCWTTESGSYLS